MVREGNTLFTIKTGYDDKHWTISLCKQWKGAGFILPGQKYILNLSQILPIYWTLKKFGPFLI